MKKLIIAFGFLLFLPLGTPAEAEVVNYWDYWANKSQATTQKQSSSYYNRPTYTRRTTYSTPRVSTSSRTTTATSGRSSWMNYLRSKYAGRSLYNSTSNTARSIKSGVRATVTPITLRQSINDITAAPVDLFRVGLAHHASAGSDYVAAVHIDEMRFQITDNSGVVSDFSDFALVTEGEDFDFDSRGFLTIRFNDLRLAKSESRALDISIKIDEPDNFPRLPGSFRVKLSSVSAYKEFSQASVPVEVSGRSVSNYVVLNPRGSVSAGNTNGTANAYTGQTVVGRPLGGSEKALLMTLTLNASLDDFLLEELSVRNQYGNNADKLVHQLNLVNLSNGKIIDSTRFVGGVARFDLNNQQQVYISRNSRIKLGIEAQIVSSPNVDNIDNRLTLLLDSDDIDLFGIGAGREVPSSRKTVSVDAETFTVSRGTLTAKGGIYFSSTQPSLFTGTPNQAARFKIVNAGSQEVSFARFTLQVVPNGIAFATGTTADFQLVELINGVTQRNQFTTTAISGNNVTFDALNEIYVDGGQTREFALILNATDVPGDSDGDSIGVRILGDATLQQGDLSSVRGASANLIWSDHSGRPHIPGSTDWFSGFQFSGVPTNLKINKR